MSANNPQNLPTFTLRGNVVVLAKADRTGRLHPVTYANRTQANAKVEALGPGWYVSGRRPFYATREPAAAPAKEKNHA